MPISQIRTLRGRDYVVFDPRDLAQRLLSATASKSSLAGLWETLGTVKSAPSPGIRKGCSLLPGNMGCWLLFPSEGDFLSSL